MALAVFELPNLDRRRFCECCGYPTLPLPDDRYHSPQLRALLIEASTDGTQWDGGYVACDLCEWENAPLAVDDGRIESSDEERNDGLSLDAARQNLAMHRSIYDPANLPIWKLAPPSAAVDDARDVLRSAYQDVMDVPLAERWKSWNAVLDAERVLRDALAAQREEDQALDADEALDEDFPSDEPLNGDGSGR